MRVLIATVTAGAGHVQAANALEEAWRSFRPRDLLRKLDVLDFTPRWYRHAYLRGYPRLVQHAPDLWGMIYKKTDDPARARRLAGIRRLTTRLPAARFIRELRKFAPDAVLCTHYLPTELTAGQIARGKTEAGLAVIVTDFEAHALWMEPEVDLYCVAAEETKARLLARGVPAGQVVVTGIPIAARFSRKIEAAAVRRRLGLDDDRPTLLVLGGGFGLGPVEEIAAQLNKVERPFQALVVCGRNEKLRARLAAARRRYPARILGFVDNIEELMTVADAVVGKPGGLTSSEALALGRPLFIVDPIPGQEAANSDFLLERGAAVKISRPEDLAFKLGQYLGTKKLERLARAARAVGRPGAAAAVCREVFARLNRVRNRGEP